VVREGDFISVQWRRIGSGLSLDESPIVKTHLTGTYNLPNIMAAVATGIVFGLRDEEIAAGISGYLPTNNRSEVRKKGSVTYILDAYNANPSSMEVAINNLVGSDGDHSVILGEMLEVGATSTDEHRAVCARLLQLKLKTVCLVGNEFYRFKGEFPFAFFQNVDDLNAWLQSHTFEHETVLIKGSRGNKLEKAAELLLA
jgi:UDP-N-acetylmuramoyl-tripeptide--D-alanyl-D-alanine ligase